MTGRAARAALRPAVLEFRRGLTLPGRPAPGGRDHAALVALMTLLITMIALALDARRSLETNLVHALVGHVPGAGTPLIVQPHVDRLIAGFDARALAVFRNHGGFAPTIARHPDQASPLNELDAFPFVEIEPESPFLRLAGWAATGTSEAPRLSGWAVDRNNPLWRNAVGDDGRPLTIVIDRRLARRAFSYAAYRAAVAPRLPAPARNALPVTVADPAMLDTLYFDVIFSGEDTRLVPFSIVWVDGLPALQEIAMLVPIDVLARASAAFRYPALAFVTERDRDEAGDPAMELTRLTALDTDLAADGTEAGAPQALATCLGSDVTTEIRPTRTILHVNGRYSYGDFTACMTHAGIGTGARIVPGFRRHPTIEARGRALSVACDGIEGGRIPHRLLEACRQKSAGERAPFTVFSGFRAALVFVPDGISPAEALSALLAERGDKMPGGNNRIFLTAESYRDAVTRISYSHGVIAYLGAVLAALGLAIAACVMAGQILPMLDRRRRTFGLMLARGIPAGAIALGLVLQIALAATIATVCAFLLRIGVITLVDLRFTASPTAELARTMLGVAHPVLLGSATMPAAGSAASLFAGAGLVTLIAIAAAALGLWRIGLTPDAAPVDLMTTASGPRRTAHKRAPA